MAVEEEKVADIMRWNPPAPPDVQHEGVMRIRLIAAEKTTGVQSIVHLLDQYLLETPPVSEDESVNELVEVITSNKSKTQEPPVQGIELELDSLASENLQEFIAEEKRKMLARQKQEKKNKKREDKSEKEDNIKTQRKHSGTTDKTVSVQKKSHKSTIEESLIADESNSSSPTVVEIIQRPRSKSPSSNRSSKRLKSSIVVVSKNPGHAHEPDMELRPERRSGYKSSHRSSRWESPVRRSPSGSPDSQYHKERYSTNPKHGSRLERGGSYKGNGSVSPDSQSHKERYSTNPKHGNRLERGESYKGNVSVSPDSQSQKERSSPHTKHGNRLERGVSSKGKGSASPDRIRGNKSPNTGKLPYQKSVRSRISRSPDKEKESVDNSWKAAAAKPKSVGSKIIRSPDKEKESVDTSRKAAAAKPKFKNFVVKDEYTEILAEEMRRHQLIEDADDEPVVSGALGVPLKEQITLSVEEGEILSEDQENLVKYELGIVNPKEMKTSKSFPQTKFFKQEKIVEPVNPDRKDALLNGYYCQVCQLGLNSDLTWHSHISGKKHAKMLQVARVHEIARGSIPMPQMSTPKFVSEDIPRFANVPAGKIRFLVDEDARLMNVIMRITDRPVPGLRFIQEIIASTEITYYCELCDAPCGSSSIVPHLIGQKHQLKCLKQIDPVMHESNKMLFAEKKRFGPILHNRLLLHEQQFGRGDIKVFREENDSNPRPPPCDPLPGPSWRNTSSIPVLRKERKEDGDLEIPDNDECLDTSKGDFFCKLCDSHMNNQNMWEAHVRGKRHLKNAKKIPGENISKLKSVKAPGAPSKLEELLQEVDEFDIVVGLDYIKETKGLNGELYNCFLCGSCSTNYDIKDHIQLPKHRLRYLEQLISDGKPNNMSTISQMEFQDPWFRQKLVDDECHRMVAMYGRGKVEVYVSKN